MRRIALLCALSLLVSPVAFAGPGRDGPGRDGPKGPPPDRAQREQMLRRVHTAMVLELGELLGLDTAGTIKLSDRLKKYEDQRVQLRLDSFDGMAQLRRASKGEGAGIDAAATARKLAANRVKLAEVDQKELEDVLQGLPADKAAAVAIFLTEFPRRIERMAHGVRERGGKGGPRGPEGEDD